MITKINSKERLFRVHTSNGDNVFCNLNQLNSVVKHLNPNPGYFKIYHFWNNSFKVCSKKYLKELFESVRGEMKFEY